MRTKINDYDYAEDCKKFEAKYGEVWYINNFEPHKPKWFYWDK